VKADTGKNQIRHICGKLSMKDRIHFHREISRKDRDLSQTMVLNNFR